MEFWVRVVLGKQNSSEELEFVRNGGSLERELEQAKKYYCDLLFYDGLKNKDLLNKELQQKMEIAIKYNRAVIQNQTEQIKCYGQIAQSLGQELVLVKGLGVSMFYPKPYLRRAGDVDILLQKNKINQFLAKTSPNRLKRNIFTAMHHNVQENKAKMIYLEVHKELAWLPLTVGLNGNNYTFVRQSAEYNKKLGVFVPSIECSAYVLLMHILNHLFAKNQKTIIKNYIDLYYLVTNKHFNLDKFKNLLAQSSYKLVLQKVYNGFVKYVGLNNNKYTMQLNISVWDKLKCKYFVVSLRVFRKVESLVKLFLGLGKKID